MRPIIKFKYGKARCPLCLADHGSRKLYRSVDAIREHLNLDHSYGSVYFYGISSIPTCNGTHPFTVHGSCSCGCGEPIRYPSLTAITPFMPNHGPPYYLAGHKTRIYPNSGMYKKGNIPWSNGLKGKGICKPNSGSFKKGCTPSNYRGGLYTAPNGQVCEWTQEYHPSGTRKYRARSRRIMEEMLGRALRDDEVVIHLNGNTSNDEPINLKVISRSENAARNRWGGHRAKQKVKVERPRKKSKEKVKRRAEKEIKDKEDKEDIVDKDIEETMEISVERKIESGSGPFCAQCGTLKLPRGPCPRCNNTRGES